MPLSNIPATAQENAFVRLEPFDPAAHLDGLREAAAASKIFTWLALDGSTDIGFRALIDDMTDRIIRYEGKAGDMLPWIVRSKPTGRIVGSTRYLNFMPAEEGVEIGWTWYHPDVWAGPVNPSCKLLLLDCAFKIGGAERVALRCDAANRRSHDAIARLGAVKEGVLRHERRRRDGSWRDTATFSILRDEWPVVEAGLKARLASV